MFRLLIALAFSLCLASTASAQCGAQSSQGCNAGSPQLSRANRLQLQQAPPVSIPAPSLDQNARLPKLPKDVLTVAAPAPKHARFDVAKAQAFCRDEIGVSAPNVKQFFASK